MAEQPELEFLLGWDEPDLMESFLKNVANGGLSQYKRIIQWGEKAGEPLFTHAVNGIFTANQLRPILNLADNEIQVLFSAYAIHDLNKSLDSGEQSFNRLASTDAVKSELENVGVPNFFPAYVDYLEDITTLIRSHSGHYHTDGEWLIRAHNPYRLTRERLDMLRSLIKGLDEVEMSSSLNERDHKQGFLVLLNTCTEKQYEFVYHQVGEQRGLLTNLIHNQIKDYLSARYGLLPLLFYPDGIAYLKEKGQEIVLSMNDLSVIGLNVARTAANMTRGSFTKFIKSGNQGIKIDKQCIELGIPFDDMWGVVYHHVTTKINGKRFKIEGEDGMEYKCRGAFQAALTDDKYKELHERIKQVIELPNLCPTTQAGMGAAELLRSYYIFLNAHFGKRVGNAWNYLYELLSLPVENTKLYDVLDPLFQRAYFIGQDQNLTLEPLLAIIQKDGNEMIGVETNTETERLGDYEALSDYVARNVVFSWVNIPTTDFSGALQYYVQHNHEQCCYCGSEFETENWMSPQAPANVTVQSFSNRLSGGSSREPKRNICKICRTQFILEKLNTPTMKGIKTIYLHLYPYTFFTETFLNSLRFEIGEILSTDTSVLFPKTDETIKEIIESDGKRTPLRFYTRNKQGNPYTNGIPLPLNYSEVIGNILTFPLNCPGDNNSEQFLFALQNAILLGRYFGCKVVMTDSAVPILNKQDFGSLFVDNIPLGFGGFLPKNNLDPNELQMLWADITGLFRLRGLFYDRKSEENLYLPLIKSLASDSRFELFHLADVLIEKKADNEWQATRLVKESLPIINKLLKGAERMKALQTLAETAWRDHIIGSSLKRNSLLKPFDMMLDALEAKSEAFGLDTVKAQLVEQIFQHMEAIASDEYKPGRTKREKVKIYVDLFFDGVLAGPYHGNVQKLLADVKPLRSAYLFYVREQIPTTQKEK